MFTVGYGETYPHTLVGKVSAIVLMVVGIAFFGWATAALASLFIEDGSEIEAKQERAALKAQIQALDTRLERIEQLLGGRSGDPGAASPDDASASG